MITESHLILFNNESVYPNSLFKVTVEPFTLFHAMSAPFSSTSLFEKAFNELGANERRARLAADTANSTWSNEQLHSIDKIFTKDQFPQQKLNSRFLTWLATTTGTTIFAPQVQVVRNNNRSNLRHTVFDTAPPLVPYFTHAVLVISDKVVSCLNRLNNVLRALSESKWSHNFLYQALIKWLRIVVEESLFDQLTKVPHGTASNVAWAVWRGDGSNCVRLRQCQGPQHRQLEPCCSRRGHWRNNSILRSTGVNSGVYIVGNLVPSDNHKHTLSIPIELERLVQGLRFNYELAYVQKKRVETCETAPSLTPLVYSCVTTSFQWPQSWRGLCHTANQGRYTASTFYTVDQLRHAELQAAVIDIKCGHSIGQTWTLVNHHLHVRAYNTLTLQKADVGYSMSGLFGGERDYDLIDAIEHGWVFSFCTCSFYENSYTYRI